MTNIDNPEYDPVFVITPLGLRRIALEDKDCAGTITRKEAQELRRIKAGLIKLSEADELRTVIPHLSDWNSTQAVMRRLSEIEPRRRKKIWKPKVRRIDPRFFG